MAETKSYLKVHCDPVFIKTFRAILYHPRLSWPAKCLALALLEVKPDRKPKLAKFDNITNEELSLL